MAQSLNAGHPPAHTLLAASLQLQKICALEPTRCAWACQAGQDLASTHLFRSLQPLLGTLVRCRATEGQAFASGKEAQALNKITQPVPSFQSTGWLAVEGSFPLASSTCSDPQSHTQTLHTHTTNVHRGPLRTGKSHNLL